MSVAIVCQIYARRHAGTVMISIEHNEWSLLGTSVHAVGRSTGRGGPEGFWGVGEEVTISVTKVKGEAAGYCLVTAERDG